MYFQRSSIYKIADMDKIMEVLVYGLTYDGQMLHIVINYTLIFICLYPFFKLPEQWKKVFKKYCISILVIMSILQTYFWFTLDTMGVSLIWSALAGLNILILLRIQRQTTEAMPLIKKLLWISLLCVLLADIYYWFTFPTITTIAHLAATFLGIGIYGVISLISMITGEKRS